GGDDTLTGGGGNNILLGGDGNDVLQGGLRRDLLFGGDGTDNLKAGGRDALLVGGWTAYDGDLAVLDQLLAEWASSDPYGTRAAKLGTGTPTIPQLSAAQIADGYFDVLTGGTGSDLFFFDDG